MITLSGTLSKGWMHRALGVTFDRDYYFDPAKRHAVDVQCNAYAAEAFPEMGLFYSESNLGRLDYWSPDLVQIGGIQPNMILGLLLGAELVPSSDRDADITPHCLAGRDVSQLPDPAALLDHDVIRLFDEQIAGIRTPLRPIAPFFWDASGRAAIHGALTSAQKLWGESIFLEMMTEPHRCRRRMQWLVEAYIILCRHFADAVDVPISEIHVGECSSCMVGPELIEQFVVPVTSSIGRSLGPVRYHSCGTSTHLLKVLAKIENLQALDLGGETSLAVAREVFGPQMRISIAPLPCHLSAQDTAPIRTWARNVLRDNDGGVLEFVYHLEPDYNIETVRALTDLVRAHDAFGQE